MKSRKRVHAAAIVASLLLAYPLAAADLFEEPWRWVRFGEESGLPSDQILQVEETTDGTAWVNTAKGVAWFDGYRWNPARANDALPPVAAQCLCPLPDGRLLFTLVGKLYEGGKAGFRHIELPTSVGCMGVLDPETVIMHRGVGHLSIRTKDGTTRPFPLPDDQTWRVQGLFRGRYSVLLLDRQGLYRLRGVENPETLISSPTKAGFSFGTIAENARGEGIASIGTPQDKVGIWSWTASRPPRRVEQLPADSLQTADISPTGEILMIYRSGHVMMRSQGVWRHGSRLPPPIWDATTARYRDNGDLWVGTTGGLFLHRSTSQRWTNSVFPFPDNRNSVNALVAGKDGTVLAATAGGLVVRKADGSVSSFDRPGGPSQDAITGVASDEAGNIWISSGSSFAGAWRWNGSRWDHFGAAQGLADLAFHRIQKDSTGRLWFLNTGFSADGIKRESRIFTRHRGQFENWGREQGQGDKGAYAIAEGPDGAFWFATRFGVSRWHNGSWRHWERYGPEGKPGDPTHAFCILVDRNSLVWLGNRANGLSSILPDGSVRNYTTSDGLASNQVWDVQEDIHGTLWVATSAGLSVLRHGELSRFGPKIAPLNLRPVWPILVSASEVCAGTIGSGTYCLDLKATQWPAPRIEIDKPMRQENEILLRWKANSYWGDPPVENIETRHRIDAGPWSGWNLTREVRLHDLQLGERSIDVQARGLLGVPGDPVRLQFRVIPVFYKRPAFFLGASGALLIILALLIDRILRRRRHLRQLEQSEARYRGIVEDQTELICRLEPGGAITFVNDAYCRYFSKDRADLLGRDLYHMLRREEPETLQKALGGLTPESPTWETERSITLNGLTVWQRWIVRAIFNSSGRISEYQCVGRDITDRKRSDEALAEARRRAEQASLAKSEFLATMSHEIRTPLNGIVGMANLMGATPLSPEQAECNDTIRTSADALLVIINDILDLSRIEAGRLVLEINPFDLKQTLAEVLEILAPAARGRELQVSLIYSTGVPRRFLGDSGRIRQIILNLAANAVKFTSAGKVVLRVEAGQGSAGEPRALRISVEDTGIGIPAEKIGVLFKKFSQVDSSPSRRYEGTGLGLAISKSLAELMGGSISVSSQLGVGSTFSVHLSLPLASEARPAPADLVAAVNGQFGETPPPLASRPVILVVEDNAVNRKVAVRLLEKLGYTPEIAVNGAEAVRMAALKQYAAILMDCRMPEMDGYEATFRIRRAQDPARRVPIIAMTANAMHGDPEKCLDAGMDDFLAKPVSLELLQKMLKYWITAQGATRPPLQGRTEPSLRD
ncbi:MAG: response regulator [Acidimicrobiia bacterium]|nr:response regulator [Acidimicrobiia bacterium]